MDIRRTECGNRRLRGEWNWLRIESSSELRFYWSKGVMLPRCELLTYQPLILSGQSQNLSVHCARAGNAAVKTRGHSKRQTNAQRNVSQKKNTSNSLSSMVINTFKQIMSPIKMLKRAPTCWRTDPFLLPPDFPWIPIYSAVQLRVQRFVRLK
jgi:hypothetical protein